jgi:hypothetical protein
VELSFCPFACWQSHQKNKQNPVKAYLFTVKHSRTLKGECTIILHGPHAVTPPKKLGKIWSVAKDFPISIIWADETLQLDDNQDPWWQFDPAISHRKETIQNPSILVVDESMSAFAPHTSKTGGLPNISFIKRKPEHLDKCCF